MSLHSTLKKKAIRFFLSYQNISKPYEMPKCLPSSELVKWPRGRAGTLTE